VNRHLHPPIVEFVNQKGRRILSTAKFVTRLPYFGLLRGRCRERFEILSLDWNERSTDAMRGCL